MLRWAIVVLSSSFLTLACASAALRSTPAPARVEAPAELLPSDLDAALRVDMARLASELGARLTNDAVVDLLVERADEAALAWLSDVIGRAEVTWLGLRGAGDLHAMEKVLIARGDFAGWKPPAPAGFRWNEAAESSPPHYSRETGRAGSFERIYPFGDRLLALSTSAQMVSFGGRPSGAALRPPERGTVSAAARADELRHAYFRAFPRLAERLSGAEHVAGYVEPHALNLDLRLDITFGAAEQASGGAEVMLALLERIGEQPCAIGEAARAARVEAFERSVSIRAELAGHVVQGLESCAFTGDCCGAERAD